MDSKNYTRVFPAEWDTDAAIMIAWPHEETDWEPMLADVEETYTAMAEAFSRYHTVVIVAPDISKPKKALSQLTDRKILFVQTSTNDTWTRDYGPITVSSDNQPLLLDFCFNGWGLKFAANHDNLVTSKLVAAGAFRADRENHLGFVMEGGSIDSNGKGSLLTTSECLMSPNRNGDLSREQIEDYLKDSLGVNRVLWIDHGYLAGDDTDSHVDTLARFAPNDIILHVAAFDPSDEHFEALTSMAEDLGNLTTESGSPFNLVALPLPDAIYDEDGQRLPATYANFLATDKAVFMPTYRQPNNDRLAAQILKIAFPDHEIVEVDCYHLIRQHGSLHCATMQIPQQILPI